MATPKSDLEQLANALKPSERLIKVFVGKRAEPFPIQETLLCSMSDYFVKAIEHEHLGGEDNIGVLRFPEDDEDAWKIIRFWIFRREVPKELREDGRDNVQQMLVLAWILADRYLMPDLQDAIMVTLLWQLDDYTIGCGPYIAVLQQSAIDSVLSKLMREEMAYRICYTGNGAAPLNEEQKLSLNAAPGSYALSGACLTFCTQGYLSRRRLSRIQDNANTWRNFMVGGELKDKWFLKQGQ